MPTECGRRFGRNVSRAALRTHVSYHDDRATAGARGERFGDLLQRGAPACTDGDTDTRVCQGFGDAAADAAAGSRDQRGLAFQSKVHRHNSS